MHPTAQRTIRRVLRAIADGGDQVLFSTHSPLLVDVAYFDEIIRVDGTNRSGQKPAGNEARAFQLPMAYMIGGLDHSLPSTKPTDTSMRERYGHAYTPTRNEGFFAKKRILVEGATEAYCLPIFGQACGHDFDTLGVATIECGGKNQIDCLYRVFNELGIPCYVLFDYDKSNSDPDAVKASKSLLAFLGQDIDGTSVGCYLRLSHVFPKLGRRTYTQRLTNTINWWKRLGNPWESAESLLKHASLPRIW